MTRFIVGVLLTCGFAVSVATAQPIKMIEDFEDIQPGEDSTRGWTFGVFASDEGVIALGGGDNHVFSAHVDNWGVNLFTKSDGSNPWVGNKDFRADGVVGINFSTRGKADFDNSIRDMSIALLNDNGTPNDSSDDFGFYRLSPEDYDFDASDVVTFRWRIPSAVTGSTPALWRPWDLSGGGDTSFTWDEIITDVDRIQINYYNPHLFYIFQGHDVIVDNIQLLMDATPAP